MLKNRGKFIVGNTVLRTADYEELRIIFQGFIPYYIDTDLIRFVTVYSGVHPEFRTLSDGEKLPEYKPELTIYEDKIIKRKWILVE